jgi:hypothetical protein
MSETIKINLTKISVVLVIVIGLSSVVGAGYIAYDNAKTAKADIKEFRALQEAQNKETDRRMSEVEEKQARFEGKMDERTANTLTQVNAIWKVVSEWEPR